MNYYLLRCIKQCVPVNPMMLEITYKYNKENLSNANQQRLHLGIHNKGHNCLNKESPHYPQMKRRYTIISAFVAFEYVLISCNEPKYYNYCKYEDSQIGVNMS